MRTLHKDTDIEVGNNHKCKIQKSINFFFENDFNVTKSIHKRTQTLKKRPGKVTKDEL